MENSRWAVMLGSLILFGVATIASGSSEGVMLLTKEEAASLIRQPSSGLVDVAAGLDDGPKIEMILPGDHGSVRSPFPLHIRFTPMHGREVVLMNLRVELVKVLSFDITHRVQPYVSKEGIRIDRVALPEGEFRFRVSLGDISGGVSTKMFSVKVL